jgi:dihydropyrimidinase
MSLKKVVIKNGDLIGLEDSTIPRHLDLIIENEKITFIGEASPEQLKGAEIIDASSCYVMPGGIDAHTHMELPVMGTFSSDDFYTGTRAALAGGTTTIIDFANQVRGETLEKTLNDWKVKATGKVLCDYGLHITVTEDSEAVLAEMEEMVSKEGVTSFKTFLAYKNMILSKEAMKRILKKASSLGALVTVHAEMGEKIDRLILKKINEGELSPLAHEQSRPIAMEDEAVELFIKLVEEVGPEVCAYVVHTTSGKAASLIRSAGERGVQIWGETCPQYLFLNRELYEHQDFNESSKYVMSPPLRDEKENEKLWKEIGMPGGVCIVATDHCPFNMAQKRKGLDDFRKIPNGIAGVENRLQLLFSEGVVKGRIGIARFVELVSTNPAKLFGLYPKKGILAVGSDADLVIWDPRKEWKLSAETQLTHCDYNPYEGWRGQGQAKTVFSRGEIMISDFKMVNGLTAGRGLYLKRSKPVIVT